MRTSFDLAAENEVHIEADIVSKAVRSRSEMWRTMLPTTRAASYLDSAAVSPLPASKSCLSKVMTDCGRKTAGGEDDEDTLTRQDELMHFLAQIHAVRTRAGS